MEALDNLPSDSARIASDGISALRERLPPTWKIEPLNDPQADLRGPKNGPEVFTISDPNAASYTRLVIQARRSFAPRDAIDVLKGLHLLRRMNPDIAVVVVAPWLSPRTQKLLEDADVGYIDLTGNAHLVLSRPGLFLHTTGADKDPSPALRGQSTLRGRKAGRVVRLLVDVRPPYAITEVARAANVDVSYVSRLVETLNREALVERTRRGGVADVLWPELIRRRAQVYSVFGTNSSSNYIAPAGASQAYANLSKVSTDRLAVTGSFGAAKVAPVAAPNLLIIYTSETAQLAGKLNLLPTDEGANVVLAHPYDKVVFVAVRKFESVPTVALSQLALDCLTGNGRMPDEGEALIQWMTTHESEWRMEDLSAFERAMNEL